MRRFYIASVRPFQRRMIRVVPRDILQVYPNPPGCWPTPLLHSEYFYPVRAGNRAGFGLHSFQEACPTMDVPPAMDALSASDNSARPEVFRFVETRLEQPVRCLPEPVAGRPAQS